MTLDEACGIKNPQGMSFDNKIDRYIEFIGRDSLSELLPRPVSELAKFWLKDEDLNNVPLSEWTQAAGYNAFKDNQSTEIPRPHGPFANLLKSRRVTGYAMSEAVCILKRCAALECRDYLRRVLGSSSLKPGSMAESMAMWAVFENIQPHINPGNKHNIFDFECKAVFQSKETAQDYEREGCGRRVMKKIKLSLLSEINNGGETHA